MRELAAVMALTSMIFSSGCFIPPGDHYLNNRPPRIRTDLLSPPVPLIRISDDLACQVLTFSVRVEDPDLEDLIRYNWFVDDRRDAGIAPRVDGGDINNPQLKALRESSISWQTVARSPSSPLYARQAHFVEVVVADGNLDRGPPNFGRIPDPIRKSPNYPPEATYADSYSWTVVTDTDVTCVP